VTGLNKFSEKDRRRQRRSFKDVKERNPIAKDLGSAKYRQRTVPNKRRIDNEDGSFYFQERYYDEDDC
jgi:hypothetical protein